MNQSYISEDAWKIIEIGFQPDRVRGAESIFSIGNGAMGQRANFEEYYSGPSFQGSYIGGVYYPDKTRVGWWKNGYPEFFAKVLNAPNWIGIDIEINELPLDLFAAKKIHQFSRELNMEKGLYTRKFELEMTNGTHLRAVVKRFVSMDQTEMGAIEYNIELLSENASFNIAPYLSGRIKNEDSNWEDPFWSHLQSETDHQSAYLVSKTLKTEFHVCTYMHTELNLNGTPLQKNVTQFSADDKSGFKAEFKLYKGDQINITKYGGYITSLNHSKENLKSLAKQKVNEALDKGFLKLYQNHTDCWAKIWEISDIKIKGDLSAQQGIRFNIFQPNFVRVIHLLCPISIFA